MAIDKNPTKTRTIEANWKRQINKRWRAFKDSAVSELRLINAKNIDPFGITNKGALFNLDARQQRVYMAFLQRQIDELLMGSTEAPNWQAIYQRQAYERGLDNARRNLLSQGASLVPTMEEVIESQQLSQFTAIPSLGTSVVSSAPIHQDALEFLYNRSYDSLKGWTDAMAKQTRQILFDGIAQGKGIDEVVREMTARIDVSRSRARVIAQTETIQAYQQSNTNEAQRASDELGIEVGLRWLTVMDSRVRHLHANWHGTIVTPKKNRARINESPWNCRCAQSPVVPGANTDAKKKKFAKERKQLLSVERK